MAKVCVCTLLYVFIDVCIHNTTYMYVRCRKNALPQLRNTIKQLNASAKHLERLRNASSKNKSKTPRKVLCQQQVALEQEIMNYQENIADRM